MQSSSTATNSSTMTLPTTTAVAYPQTPATSSIQPVEAVRLCAAEQFLIGMVSGILSALGLSTVVKWLLFVVILPSMALELWEAYQITFGNPNMAEMKQRKRLRQQQFGHGVISGSGVSHLVSDMIFQPSIFTLLNAIMYVCVSLCWTIFWALPTMSELELALRETPEAEAFFSKRERKSSSLLKKYKSRSSSSSRRKKQKLELPMGDRFATVPAQQKKSRVPALA